MSKLSVAFIVRCSEQDGLGHFNRSLALFRAMRERSRCHFFLVGDFVPHSINTLTRDEWSQFEEDSKCTQEVVNFHPNVSIFDALLFDNYSFDLINSISETISLSPDFNCLPKINLLFHRTTHYSANWGKYSKFPEIIHGLDYAIISSDIERVAKNHFLRVLRKSSLNIGVSMGGIDSFNDTLSILAKLGKSKNQLTIWVAIGPGYFHSIDFLLSVAKENNQEVIIIKSNESIWRIFENVSLVVCAGGITSYEACYVGIPTIVLSKKPEWRYLNDELELAGASIVIDTSVEIPESFLEIIEKFVADPSTLQEMRESALVLQLKSGAGKVADTIIERFDKLNVN